MGKTTGFKEFKRELPPKRPAAERIRDFDEIYLPFPGEKLNAQAARCMDCGVPTCIAGCPLGNRIPDFNDLVYRRRWREAFEQLAATNNFPEFTGRLCPAPCEEACVLGINDEPVTIEVIEKEIIEHAFANGWVLPEPPTKGTGKKVAVIGSGPAGLACARQLNHAGHAVTVFERDDRLGGLLRYGIPDFKLDRRIIDRRLKILAAEGIAFKTGILAGVGLTAADLNAFDAVVICTGATRPRDLPLPGRELAGIHFAMDFLAQQNRRTSGGRPASESAEEIDAAGKHVIVIGGGDTGSDCIGTCHRQGAKSVVNFQYSPRPPEGRPENQPWPFWPMRLRSSTSHEEGGDRQWNVLTKCFKGERKHVTGLVTVDVAFEPREGGRAQMVEVPGSEREWPAALVLLAVGYSGPEPQNIISDYGLKRDSRGNIATDETYRTSATGVFAAGDARRGQSLIVWAISEGREAARAVDTYLMGASSLPSKGCCDLPRA
jgi:glutamate synthase (NADPH/NADH) small chain